MSLEDVENLMLDTQEAIEYQNVRIAVPYRLQDNSFITIN